MELIDEFTAQLLSEYFSSGAAREDRKAVKRMFGPMKTEDIKKACRSAYSERNKAAFGDAASHLLIRGYAPVLGVRGGISFSWVGATRNGDEHWQAVKEQFALVDWQ